MGAKAYRIPLNVAAVFLVAVDLRGKSMALRINGSAHDRQELRVDQYLAADDGEHPRLFGISRCWASYSVEVASSQRST